MKKLSKFLVAALLGLSMAACGSSSAPAEEPAAEAEAPAAEATAETAPAETEAASDLKIAYIVSHLGDKSFADSGERGMEQLRKEGYDAKTFEIGDDASKYEDQILDTIDQGYNLIYASSTYFDQCHALAEEYPDVKFVIFDDNKAPEELLDNEAVIFYAQNEGSYLVGMMAAAMSKSGSVAVNYGMPNPVIFDFVTGYVNGVKDWNEANGTNVKVIAAQVGSWSDPATMKDLCLGQARDNKTDVFYQVAGGSGDGLFEACVETGTWAIGVDSDQYQAYKDSENPEKADVILTSMLKEVGNSLVSMTHSIDNGEDVWKKTTTLGLAQDSVGYVDNEFFQANVPAEVRDAMAKAAEEVKSGSKDVKSYFDFASEDEFNAYLEEVK
jgi:basic membrane protein A